MSLGDLVKQLFRLAIAAWWSKITEEYSTSASSEDFQYPTEYGAHDMPEYRELQAYREDLYNDYWSPLKNIYGDRKEYKDYRHNYVYET